MSKCIAAIISGQKSSQDYSLHHSLAWPLHFHCALFRRSYTRASRTEPACCSKQLSLGGKSLQRSIFNICFYFLILPNSKNGSHYNQVRLW